MLIVLDNARDSEQVLPLLPGSPTCTVLVTSRRLLGGLSVAHGLSVVSLETLDEDAAIRLLADHLGERRIAGEPAAAAELVQRCAGLPLALAIAAARAAANDFPLARLAGELRDASARLDALEIGELSTDLRAVFQTSMAALSPGAYDVFRWLAQAPDRTSAWPRPRR